MIGVWFLGCVVTLYVLLVTLVGGFCCWIYYGWLGFGFGFC